MLVGIHRDLFGQFRDLNLKFEKILQFNNIPCVRLEASQPDFWEIVPRLDLFIFSWIHYDAYFHRATTILPVIEKHYGVKCLPDQATCWHYDDKIKQYLLLEAHGFPVVPSWVFWEKPEALAWIKTAPFPLVFKLKSGAGSSSVLLVKNQAQARRLIHIMFGRGMVTGRIPSLRATRFRDFNPYKELRHLARRMRNRLQGIDPFPYWQRHKNYIYFQKFLPGNRYDTRITTIGDRIFAFRRFVRKNDFRASGSDNWSLDRSRIDMEMVKLGLEISQKMGFQVMAYDFIYDENGKPRIVEISYTYGDYPEFSTGYWDADLNWHDGSYWSQYLELVDALGIPRLKQPEIKPTGHYAEVMKK
jgi:glutathione synthase/RimK-type ligase-like ATP-grasp enzyme